MKDNIFYDFQIANLLLNKLIQFRRIKMLLQHQMRTLKIALTFVVKIQIVPVSLIILYRNNVQERDTKQVFSPNTLYYTKVINPSNLFIL